MRPAPLRPQAAPSSTPQRPSTAPGAASTAPRYLTNDEAATFLRLSPRTLEKQRVIGGGPRFRKFGRRVMYALSDLEVWADSRSFEATCDPEYAQHRAEQRAARRDGER